MSQTELSANGTVKDKFCSFFFVKVNRLLQVVKTESTVKKMKQTKTNPYQTNPTNQKTNEKKQ